MSDSFATDQELIDALQLHMVPGIGPRWQRALLDHFGSPAAALAAGFDELRHVSGFGPKLARAVDRHRGREEAEAEHRRCRNAGIRLLVRETAGYPRLLNEICDAPNVLYCRGTLETPDELAIGIVGARHCTLYGRQQAERLARGLAQAGMTVVSGMARGIDAAAHRGALDAGGRTIAVSATGLAYVYPPEHRDLAAEIAEHGAIVTEFPLSQQALPGLFPQRNRVISGLSTGVIIVEASLKSGALHTARHAMEQGREVMAVPGRVDSEFSVGCLNLLRDGATLVRHTEDVLEALGPLVAPVKRGENDEVRSPRELTLTEPERDILNLVSNEPQHVDEIVQTAGIAASRVLATLTVLEVKRMVRRLPGGYLVRF